MEKCTFAYVDGFLKIEPGTQITINNYYDDPLRNWSEVDYLELVIDKPFMTIKIPKTHIVELDFITSNTAIKRNTLLWTLMGFAVGGFWKIGVQLAATGIGALIGFLPKEQKQNHFIISYLMESEPENLKVLILNANLTFGNLFVKDRQEFAERLETQIRRSTKKAACVKAFTEKLEKVLEAQGKDGNAM